MLNLDKSLGWVFFFKLPQGRNNNISPYNLGLLHYQKKNNSSEPESCAWLFNVPTPVLAQGPYTGPLQLATNVFAITDHQSFQSLHRKCV